MTHPLTAWQFGPVPRRPFTAASVYDLPAVGEWLPATVPGNVRVDLLNLGRIPDPFFAEQYRHSLWVEEMDWWYRCRPPAVSLEDGQRGWLVFHGLDYLAAVFVDGQEMARHEGMFSRLALDITAALRRPAPEIAVRLWGSTALPRRRLTPLQRLWQALAGPVYGSWVGIYPDRTATLKCQMSFGWDFAPPIRTMGIWDEVSLRLTGPAAILDAGLLARPAAAGPRADVSAVLHLQVDADQARPAVVRVQVSPANFAGPPYPRPISGSTCRRAGRNTACPCTCPGPLSGTPGTGAIPISTRCRST